LNAVVRAVTRDELGEELGAKLEDMVFKSLKNANPFVASIGLEVLC
jgi:Cell morphogenesis N-terminal